jgi:hypothetical protein
MPNLWFSKQNIETGIVFEDVITNKNCPGWDQTPFCELNSKAKQRIDYLNKCMPGKWQYKLIGWKV